MCDGEVADHFIAYDGTTLHGIPHNIACTQYGLDHKISRDAPCIVLLTII